MKYFLILISSLLILHSNAQNNIEIDLVLDNHLYEIEGKIGELDIVMQYRLTNNSITGYYYYKKYNSPINIIGYINNDTIIIYEFDNEVNKTGQFLGVIEDNLIFKGNWTNLKNGKKTSFIFKNPNPFKNLIGWIYLKNNNSIKFYNLSDSIILKPHSLKLLDFSINKDHFYLLFKLGSMSRPNGNYNSYCGAGFEEKVVWLEIDSDCNIKRDLSYMINSCWSSYISEDDDAYWKDNLLIIEVLHSAANFAIIYDKDNPENGLSVKEIFEE